ncbi:hypothetical protein JW968_03690 [Candidatus Woesearchaeota archaeon]|nr:hypothetical protein [Candidatus Woesearchaeota archaeon]
MEGIEETIKECISDPEHYPDAAKALSDHVAPGNPSQLLHAAMLNAMQAYKDSRRRNGELSIVHPLCVSRKLSEFGEDIGIVTAGLLHDLPEDFGKRNERGYAVMLDKALKQAAPDESNQVARISAILDSVSKRGAEDYFTYLRRMSGIRVRKRDFEHIKKITEAPMSLKGRIDPIEFLQGAGTFTGLISGTEDKLGYFIAADDDRVERQIRFSEEIGLHYHGTPFSRINPFIREWGWTGATLGYMLLTNRDEAEEARKARDFIISEIIKPALKIKAVDAMHNLSTNDVFPYMHQMYSTFKAWAVAREFKRVFRQMHDDPGPYLAALVSKGIESCLRTRTRMKREFKALYMLEPFYALAAKAYDLKGGFDRKTRKGDVGLPFFLAWINEWDERAYEYARFIHKTGEIPDNNSMDRRRVFGDTMAFHFLFSKLANVEHYQPDLAYTKSLTSTGDILLI